MTLNDLERRNSPYCAFFTEIDCFLAKYVTVVEYRPVVSVNIVSQFQSSILLAITISHPAARSLCDNQATHVALKYHICWQQFRSFS